MGERDHKNWEKKGELLFCANSQNHKGISGVKVHFEARGGRPLRGKERKRGGGKKTAGFSYGPKSSANLGRHICGVSLEEGGEAGHPTKKKEEAAESKPSP